jgi:hypothetical protein
MENVVLKGLEGFEGFGHPHPGTGVYVLIGKGEVLYVGKSLNIFHRIGQHVTAMRRNAKGKRPYKGKDELPFIHFDKIMVKWVPIHQIDAEEMNKALMLVNSTIARAKRNERTDKWQGTMKVKEEPVPSPHPYLDPLFPVQDIKTSESAVYFKAIRKVL